MEEHERLLSPVEAGQIFNVSARTIKRWIESGKLRGVRPGKAYRIPESAVNELLEGSGVGPKAHLSTERALSASAEDLVREMAAATDGEVQALWMDIGKEQRRLYDAGTSFQDPRRALVEARLRVIWGEVSQRGLQRYQISIPADTKIPQVTWFVEPTEDLREEVREKFGEFVEQGVEAATPIYA